MGVVSTAHLRELDDEELIQSARGAPVEALRKIVSELARRHHQAITGFLYGMLRDRTAAEDLAQETFVRIFNHANDYKPIAKFATWLHAIARNLALNELRNRKKRPTLALNQKDGDTSENEAIERLAKDDRPPVEEAQRNETQAELRRAVDELPEPFRLVLVLCDLQQLSYQEAAAVLDVPIGTIRSRLSRARAHLEERMRKFLGSVA